MRSNPSPDSFGQCSSSDLPLNFGSTQKHEDLEDLVYLRIANQEGCSMNHLMKDTPNAPDVNRQTVLLGAQQYFRSSIPKCNNLMSIRLNRD